MSNGLFLIANGYNSLKVDQLTSNCYLYKGKIFLVICVNFITKA